MTAPAKPVIAAVADPVVMRIIPELACEVGLNESIMLLQISHWIKNSNNLKDNRYWTYQSVREMKRKAFKFWSTATIDRIVISLQEKKLIDIGNYNQIESDKTRWFALNTDGIATLKSVHLVWLELDEKPSQNETGRLKKRQAKGGLSQNETGQSQDETTIPKSPSEIPNQPKIPQIPIKAQIFQKWELLKRGNSLTGTDRDDVNDSINTHGETLILEALTGLCESQEKGSIGSWNYVRKTIENKLAEERKSKPVETPATPAPMPNGSRPKAYNPNGATS